MKWVQSVTTEVWMKWSEIRRSIGSLPWEEEARINSDHTISLERQAE